DVMAQVPASQPTYCQYKYPAKAPANIPAKTNVFFLIKGTITVQFCATYLLYALRIARTRLLQIYDFFAIVLGLRIWKIRPWAPVPGEKKQKRQRGRDLLGAASTTARLLPL